MWNLNRIVIQNLFSHVDSEYEFKNNKCTLLVGENKDDGGNNGAGKSTLFEAISIALTGKSLRDLNKENFINNDAEECMITLDLRNDVLKSDLTIIRKYFRGGKSAKVMIIEDGEVDSTITSVNEADKRITELIGVTRDDLLKYYIISQDSQYTFFTAADNEKKEILNRITSASMVNPILEKLAVDRRQKESEERELNDKLTSATTRQETLAEQLKELKESNGTADEIKVLKSKIRHLKEQLEKQRQGLSEYDERKAKLERQLKDIKIDDTLPKKMYDEINELHKKTDKYEKKIRENKRVINAAKTDLQGQVACPDCGSIFIPESELKLSVVETQEMLEAAQADNEKQNRLLKKAEDKEQEIAVKLREYEELTDKAERIQRDIRKGGRDKKDAEYEIQQTEKRISNRQQELRELMERANNNAAIRSLEDKINACEKEINSLTAQITPVSKELELIKFWIYYMGKNGFTTYLANRAVAVVEGTVNAYLKKFRSALSVNINGYKILRDGSVREKIEVFALKNGMNPQAYLGMSGGQRGRIKLAGILALQHLINMSLNGRGLNLIVLDESLSGVDSVGTFEFVNILENVGSTILFVTQNVEDVSIFSNTLKVEFEDGVSRYI